MAILATNLSTLLARGRADGLPGSGAELARRSGVSQKAINNWLNPDRGIAPQLDKLAPIARVYGLEVWQLLVPGIGYDLTRARKLRVLVDNYQHIQCPNARHYIERIAEAEADYTGTAKISREEQ